MVSKDAYYPFGMRIEGLSQTVDDPDPRYKYNGKELDEEKGLNWLAYGARYYDPELGRWHVVDPAEVEFGLYNYVYNNPVYYIDPDGRVPDVIFDGTAEDIQAAADYLDMESSLDITIDLETGKLYAEGKAGKRRG
jgi:RHS repeat-associated protein